jgi:argininosuccinate lyase
MRLWLNENLKQVENNLSKLIVSLTQRAEKEINVLMPGYTHLQRAQPIRLTSLLSFFFNLNHFEINYLTRLDGVIY